MERVFTKEELEKMGKRTVDLLIEAIESDNKEEAKTLAKRMYSEFSAMHDVYVDWLAELMNYVYTCWGEDALYQALRKIVNTSIPAMSTAAKADFRRRVQSVAFMLRGHLQPLKVEEDDEKVTIMAEPCGSGQRLLEKGAYTSPRHLTLMQKPHVITWGKTNFPIYCTHCPVLEILSIEQLGYPVTITFPATDIAQKPCRICLYKRVEDIPAEVYTRVGKQESIT